MAASVGSGANDNTVGSVIAELKAALMADMKDPNLEDKTRALHLEMYLEALAQLQTIDPVLFKMVCKEIAKILDVAPGDIVKSVNIFKASNIDEDEDEEDEVPLLEVIITNKILETHTLRTVKESKAILELKKGGWKEISELEISALAQEIGGRNNTSNDVVREVIGRIQRENLISIEDFERRPDLFMDGNGNVFSSTSRKFEDVSNQKDVIVMHKIDAIFDPSIPIPPEWEALVERTIPHDEERLTFQEHMGSGFYRQMVYDKTYIIIGGTRNGKTTIGEIIERVAGKNNVSHITLQDMAETFRPYDLLMKLYNFGDDISKDAMKDGSVFKALNGGASIYVEKKYMQGFNAGIYAKQFYGCNTLPPAPDKNDDGYYSKILLGSAPHTFLLPNEIGPDGLLDGQYNADPDLVEKMTTDPKMLSGILNWMLEGLARLMTQKGYSLKMTLEEGKVRYDAMAATTEDLTKLINQICNTSLSAKMRKADLFELTKRYCTARKIPSPSLTGFNKTLKNIGYDPKFQVKDYPVPPQVDMKDKDTKKPYIIKGLELKNNWADVMKIFEDGKKEAC
jgi:phage/plasmid-associated DNA primase